MMKKILSLALAGLLVLSTAACTKQDKPSEDSSSDVESKAALVYHIAASFPAEDEVSAQILRGAQAAAAKMGVELNFRFSYGDRAAESQFFSSIPAVQTDGILAMPVGEEASLADLSRLSSKEHIPAAVLGLSSAQNDFAGMFSADPYELGAALGKAAKTYIEENLSGKAKIGILEQSATNPAENTLRINGFLDQVKDMKDVTLAWALNFEESKDSASMQEQLDAQLKDESKTADVLLCTGGDIALAVHEALVRTQGKSAVFGLDCSSKTVEVMKASGNTIQGVAAQDYYQMGYQSMETLLTAITSQHSAGTARAIPPVALTPTTMNLMQEYIAGLTGSAAPAPSADSSVSSDSSSSSSSAA